MTGGVITGLAEADALDGVDVLHAGTRADSDQIVASGGRVLSVVGRGATIDDARARAYAGVDLVELPAHTTEAISRLVGSRPGSGRMCGWSPTCSPSATPRPRWPRSGHPSTGSPRSAGCGSPSWARRPTSALTSPDGVITDYARVIEEIDLASIAERERITRHDVKARIEEFNALAGHEHIHKGMTSRDLTENVEQMLIRDSLVLTRDKVVAALASTQRPRRAVRPTPRWRALP